MDMANGRTQIAKHRERGRRRTVEQPSVRALYKVYECEKRTNVERVIVELGRFSFSVVAVYTPGILTLKDSQ